MKFEMTTTYKFKIENISFIVDLDSSYSKVCNFAVADDFISSIKYQHCHLGYELFFIGEQPLTFLAENRVEEYKNCILCVPSDFYHLSLRQKDYRMLCRIEKNGKCHGEFAKFIDEFLSNEKPFQLKSDARINMYIKELDEILCDHKSMNYEMAQCILKLIFYKLYELNSNKKTKAFISQNESYIVKIEEFINCYKKDLSLQTIADSLCLSTKQVSRIIHKNYNKSLSALVMERKLNVACQLLEYTDSTIAEIVEHIKISSERYFYSQFKKVYGCTPSQYKAKSRELKKALI